MLILLTEHSCFTPEAIGKMLCNDPDVAASLVAWRKELPNLPWCDWEIKSDEIEIVLHPDGSDCVLGSGAFGKVSSMTLANCLQAEFRSPKYFQNCSVSQDCKSSFTRGQNSKLVTCWHHPSQTIRHDTYQHVLSANLCCCVCAGLQGHVERRAAGSCQVAARPAARETE